MTNLALFQSQTFLQFIGEESVHSYVSNLMEEEEAGGTKNISNVK